LSTMYMVSRKKSGAARLPTRDGVYLLGLASKEISSDKEKH
jgi:hypothetical protein